MATAIKAIPTLDDMDEFFKNSVGTLLNTVHLKSLISESSTLVLLDAGSTRQAPDAGAACSVSLLPETRRPCASSNTSSGHADPFPRDGSFPQTDALKAQGDSCGIE